MIDVQPGSFIHSILYQDRILSIHRSRQQAFLFHSGLGLSYSSRPGTMKTETMDVRYVARLARLHLSEPEVAEFQAQLDHVLEYVRQIGTLDLSKVEPTSHARPLANVFRKDVAEPGLGHDIVMKNAPAAANDQFIVPIIVE